MAPQLAPQDLPVTTSGGREEMGRGHGGGGGTGWREGGEDGGRERES